MLCNYVVYHPATNTVVVVSIESNGDRAVVGLNTPMMSIEYTLFCGSEKLTICLSPLECIVLGVNGDLRCLLMCS